MKVEPAAPTSTGDGSGRPQRPQPAEPADVADLILEGLTSWASDEITENRLIVDTRTTTWVHDDDDGGLTFI